MSLAAEIKQQAQLLHFDLVGICPAVAPPGLGHFPSWLSAGMAGEMAYIESRREAYEHPKHVLEGARTIDMLGMHYRTHAPADCPAGSGRIARYGWGDD